MDQCFNDQGDDKPTIFQHKFQHWPQPKLPFRDSYLTRSKTNSYHVIYVDEGAKIMETTNKKIIFEVVWKSDFHKQCMTMTVPVHGYLGSEWVDGWMDVVVGTTSLCTWKLENNIATNFSWRRKYTTSWYQLVEDFLSFMYERILS